MSQVWRISLSNLSRNLLEATELANVLQEVSSSIQVGSVSWGQAIKFGACSRHSCSPCNTGLGRPRVLHKHVTDLQCTRHLMQPPEQVTGLSKSLSGRTSTSISGNPTKLSARERIRSAVPIQIGEQQQDGVRSLQEAVATATSTAAGAPRPPHQ